MPTVRWCIKSERFLYLLGSAALSIEPWITRHYLDMCFTVKDIRDAGRERERELWGVKYNIPAGGVLCLPMLLCSSSRQSIKGIEAVRMSTGRDPFPISKPHTFSCGAKWFSFTPPAMFVTSLTTLFHCTKEWVMTPHTCPNDFVYGDTRRFQFLGEFVHGLTRVFISVWVHIGLDSRQSHWKENKIMPEFMRQGSGFV